MPAATFRFEELDDRTREYLLAARDGRGEGMPGVFAPVRHETSGKLVPAGLAIIAASLAFTLTGWLGVVYEDPSRVALIQTAGLVLGGWMVVWAVRRPLRARSPATAGWWVYADPERVYFADGPWVRVLPTAEVRGAHGGHTFTEDGIYLASEVVLDADPPRPLQIDEHARAEQLVGFFAYRQYRDGQDEAARVPLTPTQLGAVAAFAARTGSEPTDADGRLDPGLLPPGRDLPDTPPERARPAGVSVAPYIAILVAGLVCFFVMQEVNIGFHDDAMYAAVTTAPVEPQYLRQYLIDSRNTAHRADVTRRLTAFYGPPINALKQLPPGQPLRDGLVKVLEGVKTAEQPLVSIRVTEADTPPGREGGKAARQAKAREGMSAAVGQFISTKAGTIQIPAGMIVNPPPAPLGEQLLAFVEAPEDAPAAHFEVRYRFVPTADGRFQVAGRVDVRAAVDGPVDGVDELTTPSSYPADGLEAGVVEFAKLVVQKMTQ